MLKLIRKLLDKKLFSEKAQERSSVSVRYDDIGVYAEYFGADDGFVKWSEINLIAICIEDDLLPVPYWYIGRKENSLRIPNDAVGGSELFFEGLSKYIDGYGNDETYRTIIAASSAMEGSFIVWKAPDAVVA